MTQLLIMHERQDQFDNKLSVLENKQEALNNRVSEVEDAVAKSSRSAVSGYKQIPRCFHQSSIKMK